MSTEGYFFFGTILLVGICLAATYGMRTRAPSALANDFTYLAMAAAFNWINTFAVALVAVIGGGSPYAVFLSGLVALSASVELYQGRQQTRLRRPSVATVACLTFPLVYWLVIFYFIP